MSPIINWPNPNQQNKLKTIDKEPTTHIEQKEQKDQKQKQRQELWLKQFFTNEFNQRVPKHLLIKQATFYLGVTEDNINKLLSELPQPNKVEDVDFLR